MQFDYGLEDVVLLCVMLFFLFTTVAVLYTAILYIFRIRQRLPFNQPVDGSYDPVELPHRPNPPQGSVCPICFAEPPALCVETNCAHLFCGECLRTLWGLNNVRLAFDCPMCRSQVTLLFQAFSIEERETTEDAAAERENIIEFVRRYNYRQNTSGAVAILDRLRDAPILLRHLFNELRNGPPNPFLSMRLLLSFTFWITYLALPLDIIPEMFYGILGFLDDFIFTILVLFHLSQVYRLHVGRQD